ncbi:DUF1697 domain-containing protein [Isoptericola sp. G70]|uniref:DUF1697 domain-containing protein n=1 Tax=Isoptericola sp. G70 TaxID=3376633 RepID=UPI003A80B218
MTAARDRTLLVALLCAVNVGGTGKLPMSDLRARCETIGFTDVRTYIASGNVLFTTGLGSDGAREALESALREHAGRPVGVLVRTPDELVRVRDRNPFPDASPSRVGVMFLDTSPTDGTAEGATGRADEEIVLGDREVYVHYPHGMGSSRLRVPTGTARVTTRNMNTVAKLAGLAAGRS